MRMITIRPMDRETTYGNTVLRYASRGKDCNLQKKHIVKCKAYRALKARFYFCNLWQLLQLTFFSDCSNKISVIYVQQRG